MTISSRRYLSVYEHVIKYSGFAGKGADLYGLMGVNPEYLITAEFTGISFEISSLRNSHSLLVWLVNRLPVIKVDKQGRTEIRQARGRQADYSNIVSQKQS